MILKKKMMICFIGGRKIIKVEKQFSLLNYAFFKKTKNTQWKENIGQKKHDILDYWNMSSIMFFDCQK